MYEKCQGYSRSPHVTTTTTTPIYIPKLHNSHLDQNQLKYTNTPSSSTTATTSMTHQQQAQLQAQAAQVLPNSALQSFYSNYFKLNPTMVNQNTNNDNNDSLKLHKFYHAIPFKCPFCFTFKDLSGDFVEHLASKHFIELKSSYEKLSILTGGRMLNGTSAFKLNAANMKDETELGEIPSNTITNKNDYEPLAKRFLISNETIQKTIHNDNDDNDDTYRHTQQITNNHDDADVDDEDDDEDMGNGNCTNSCCNNDGNVDVDQSQQQQQQEQNQQDNCSEYNAYNGNNSRRLLFNNNNKSQFFSKAKCLNNDNNHFNHLSHNHHHHHMMNLSSSKIPRIDTLTKSLSSSALNKQQMQPQQQQHFDGQNLLKLANNSQTNNTHQMLHNLSHLMNSVSSMHCKLCNRGFEYYSNLRRHIKTKHKIFGKEVKEYVVRSNNGNNTHLHASNQNLMNQFHKSQSQQNLQINKFNNSINSNNSINNNRSNSSTPSINLNSKHENSVKNSPKSFENNRNDGDIENENQNNDENNNEQQTRRSTPESKQQQQQQQQQETCTSPSCLDCNKKLQHENTNENSIENNCGLNTNVEQQNENNNGTNSGNHTTSNTPTIAVNHQSCPSPLSTVSSHSSTYTHSSASPNSISPPRSFSPTSHQQAQLFSKFTMDNKFRTSLLESLLLKNKESGQGSIISPSASTVNALNANMPLNTLGSLQNSQLDSPLSHLSPQALQQLAHQQQLQQQLFLQNNMDMTNFNDMNNFKKLIRNFAKSNSFSYKQFEDYTNSNLANLANNFSNFNFKNAFNADEKQYMEQKRLENEQQQQQQQQQKQQQQNDQQNNNNDSNNSRYLNTSQDEQCDDDCQSNHEDYDDIENSNFGYNHDGNNKLNHLSATSSQIPTSSAIGLISQSDSPLNMKNPNAIFNNNNSNSANSNNSNIKYDTNQVRYSTEVWRCPYCCYETTSASRYNSHLVCHGWKPYLCPHCGSRSNRLPDMRTHISTFHPEHNVNTFVVLPEDEAKATLKEYMKNRAVINRKLKEMRPQPKFKCKLCPYASLYQFNLTKHVKSVHLSETCYNEPKNDTVP